MVIEWVTHLSNDFEIHVYSQRVEDIDLSTIVWHRIRKLRGPHVGNFLWWFFANQACRAWHRFRGLKYDLTFSPGINCVDADAVSVHIVFAEFVRRVRPELKLSKNPMGSWPRLLHRKLYYQVIILLERIVFTEPRVQLILTAPQTAEELKRFYGRDDWFPVVSAGLDLETFNPERRQALREGARTELALGRARFAILLVGNDWRKKGLLTLLAALQMLHPLHFDLLVVGRDDPESFHATVSQRNLTQHVHFLPLRKDIEFYYAAADVYAGPSLEDTFALPAAEAMASGLPVVISARAGASALIRDGIDGLILDDPTDAESLGTMLRKLYCDAALRTRLGLNAAVTAQQYTWERSSHELAAIFEDLLRRKSNPGMNEKATAQ